MRTTVAGLTFVLFTATTALAAPVPSRGGVERGSLQQTLEQRDVASQLAALGTTAADANAKIEKLSPADMHQLATQPRQLQAAGGLQAKTWIAIGMVVIFVAILASSGDDDEPQSTR
jgi:hypothetical protein